MRSRDAAETSTRHLRLPTVNLSDVVMDDAGQAWAVGGGGTVVRCSSTDCVRKVPSGSTNQLNRVHIKDRQKCMRWESAESFCAAALDRAAACHRPLFRRSPPSLQQEQGNCGFWGVGSIVIKCVGTVCSTVPVSPRLLDLVCAVLWRRQAVKSVSWAPAVC